jgi:hypothetical protein
MQSQNIFELTLALAFFCFGVGKVFFINVGKIEQQSKQTLNDLVG